MPSVIGDDDQGMGFGVKGISTGGEGAVGIHENVSGIEAGIRGVTNSKDRGAAGVRGEALANSGQTVGVEGHSDNSPIGTGVVGFGQATGGYFEATGSSGARGGVYGIGFEIGVSGRSKLAGEITGSQFTGAGIGVYGENNLHGGIGVRGQGDYIGVSGISNISGTGVWGEGGIGLLGRTDTGTGVYGRATSRGIAVFGWTSGTGLAGLFVGSVQVSQRLEVFGTKSAAVPHPDGSFRTFYSMESPESWFEDFGETRLVDGRARVDLDPDFALAIDTEHYHVFLTPYADSNGLYVDNRNGTGFEVREQKAGTSNLTFSFRIIAKRKDIVAERLAKVSLRTAPSEPAIPRPPSAPGVGQRG